MNHLANKKLNFLVVEDEPEIGELIALYIGVHFECEFTHAVSAGMAIEFISKNINQFDFIISDFNMPNGTGWDLFSFLNKNNIQIPFLLITSDQWTDHPEFHQFTNIAYVQKPFIDEDVIVKVNELFAKMNLSRSNLSHNYIPISISTLLRIQNIKHPLFIKISDEKFIKIVNENSIFDTMSLKKFKLKMVKELYVEKDFFDSFIKDFKSKVTTEMLFSESKISNVESFNLSISVQEVLLGALRTFGWSNEIQEMADKNLKLVKSISQNNNELHSLLLWTNDFNHDFTLAHSILISYLTTAISQTYKFKNVHAAKLLALAAFFHDVTLDSHQIKNESRFIKANSLKLNINKSDIDKVMSHPVLSSEVISNWKLCPIDLVQIILSHHELPDGTGFPRNLESSSIDELSACFIVVEDMINNYLEFKDKKNEILNYLDDSAIKFKNEPFKSFFDIVSEQIKKSINKIPQIILKTN